MHVIPFPVNFIQYYIETNYIENSWIANKQVISGIDLFDDFNLYKKYAMLINNTHYYNFRMH